MSQSTDLDFRQEQELARHKELGLLGRKYYVVFTSPAPGINREQVRSSSAEHLDFLRNLEVRGILFAAGPFLDERDEVTTGEGMFILRAASLAEAHGIVAGDPKHISGARTYRILPWIMNEGSINLRVLYASGTFEIR